MAKKKNKGYSVYLTIYEDDLERQNYEYNKVMELLDVKAKCAAMSLRNFLLEKGIRFKHE